MDRRAALRGALGDGLILMLGHAEAPMNYAHNTYPFRQDASFSYYFGLGTPDLAGVLDIDAGVATLFGDELGLDDAIWHGETPSLRARSEEVGIDQVRPLADLAAVLDGARRQGRTVHFPPPYRGESLLRLASLLDRSPDWVGQSPSTALIRAVVAQREIKGPEEIAEMRVAGEIAHEMHLAAMTLSRPGVYEREVVAQMEARARRRGCQLAYPSIFSKRGEVLHNNSHHLRLEAGDLVVNDTGASTVIGYASDITRTLPIGGRFSSRQRPIYETVLRAQMAVIAALRPGVRYVDMHRLAAREMSAGLADLGFFKGDPDEIVRSGACALAFPHGLGHQIGLDVHDMESLGEDFVGYDATIGRSPVFGLAALRLGKALKAGMVVTVEPGVYFIPALIRKWRAEARFASLINYDLFEQYAGFGGIRIEDDLLITDAGGECLAPPIPKTVEAVEAAMA